MMTTTTTKPKIGLDAFLKGYWRDLMRSQPNHIEIIVEKADAAELETTRRRVQSVLTNIGGVA